MGKFEKTIYKLLAGSSDNNFKFEELRNILLSLGFEERISSSHHIFKKKGCLGIINLQKDKNQEAKPYQVKQVRDFLTNYKLILVMKYEVIIYWSSENEAFIAEIPELKGCIAHGDTDEEALKNIKIVANEWLILAKEENWEIPTPKGRLIYA